MFNYVTINEIFINLIFPLMVAIIPLILSYFIGLIKKLDKS